MSTNSDDNSIRGAHIANIGVIAAAVITPFLTFMLGYFPQESKINDYKFQIEQLNNTVEASNTNNNTNTLTVNIDGKSSSITPEDFKKVYDELSDYKAKYEVSQSEYKKLNSEYKKLEKSYSDLNLSHETILESVSNSSSNEQTAQETEKSPLTGISLSFLEPFTKPYAGYYKTVHNITDAYGTNHPDAIQLTAIKNPDSYIKSETHILEFKLDGKYSKFSGTLSFYESTQVNAELYLAIYADGNNVKTTEAVDRRSGSKTFEADISGAQYIQIITGYNGNYNRSTSSLLLTDAILQ